MTAPNFVETVSVAACAIALILGDEAARAEEPPRWRVGGYANISADGSPETGWLLGLGVGTNRRVLDWLELQIRLLGTFRSSRWHNGEYVNPPRPSAGSDDGGHALAEATARYRPIGPVFLGLGPQVGVRILGYTECVNSYCTVKSTGTDAQPAARALFELGAEFGPSEMFEAGLRLAIGWTLASGPVERDQGTNDDELGFSFGVLLPI